VFNSCRTHQGGDVDPVLWVGANHRQYRAARRQAAIGRYAAVAATHGRAGNKASHDAVEHSDNTMDTEKVFLFKIKQFN